jgi:hypothetical protein
MKSEQQPPFGASSSVLYSLAIITALGLSGSTVFAAATANDTASNYSGGGWGATPPNDGTGFGAWSITVNNNNSPPYVGTYLDTGSPVVSGGYSWATYANGGGNNGSISILRAFTPGGVSGSSSLYNQTFSVDLSSGGVGNGSGGPPNSELSIGLGNAFSFSYLGTGSDNFLFSVDGGTPTTTPVDFSELNAGMVVSLTVSGALNSPSEDYSLSVSAISGGSPLYTQSGNFDSSVYNTSDFSYLDSNTANNNYFNNLNLTTEVPEPSTMVLGAAGLVTLLLLQRRRL